ncbi:hypothetical protein [Desulfovibrio inopinatus]|uniref:hypothetical protein n=1 Tax=Desulfovibrio inopinatus TaxID=102109 RepID=UPI000408E077|nr:hypothetical protein [Desulfovibrio inopinatus]
MPTTSFSALRLWSIAFIITTLALCTVPSPLYAEAPTAQNISPATTFRCAVNDSVVFTIHAEDVDGDLLGAEWYGCPESPSTPCISIVKKTDGKAYEAEIKKTLLFTEPGAYTISVIAFDDTYTYSDPIEWIIDVTPPHHANPVEYRSLYVDGFDSILGDSQKEQELLHFVDGHKFSEIALYGLFPILQEDSGYTQRVEQLKKFITQAKQEYGLLAVKGVGCLDTDFDSIEVYNSSCNTTVERFNGLVSEYEYWNASQSDAGDINDFVHLLTHMREIADRQDMTVDAYLGWLGTSEDKQEEAARIAEFADIIYLHAYRADPYATYAYISDRLSIFTQVKSGIRIRPIFSAEWRPVDICSGPHQTGVDNMCFMGKWYETNALRTAEDIFMDMYVFQQSELPGDAVIDGYQYFAYSHLKAALEVGKLISILPTLSLLLGQSNEVESVSPSNP